MLEPCGAIAIGVLPRRVRGQTDAFRASIEEARLKGVRRRRRAIDGHRLRAPQPPRRERLRDPLDVDQTMRGRCLDERSHVAVHVPDKGLDPAAVANRRRPRQTHGYRHAQRVDGAAAPVLEWQRKDQDDAMPKRRTQR